jgi:hypothetical protein
LAVVMMVLALGRSFQIARTLLPEPNAAACPSRMATMFMAGSAHRYTWQAR